MININGQEVQYEDLQLYFLVEPQLVRGLLAITGKYTIEGINMTGSVADMYRGLVSQLEAVFDEAQSYLYGNSEEEHFAERLRILASDLRVEFLSIIQACEGVIDSIPLVEEALESAIAETIHRIEDAADGSDMQQAAYLLYRLQDNPVGVFTELGDNGYRSAMVQLGEDLHVVMTARSTNREHELMLINGYAEQLGLEHGNIQADTSALDEMTSSITAEIEKIL